MRYAKLSAAAVSLFLLAAGCGANSPAQNNQAPPPKDAAAAAYAFSACMRDHGVTGFPDPKVTTSPGHQSIQIEAVGPNSSPAFKTAQKACGHLLPSPQNANPGQDAAHQQTKRRALLQLASCLRSHGVNGFPDPNSQGQLSMEMIQQAGIDIHTPSFERTALACARTTHGVITAAQVVAAINHRGG